MPGHTWEMAIYCCYLIVFFHITAFCLNTARFLSELNLFWFILFHQKLVFFNCFKLQSGLINLPNAFFMT